MSGEAGRLVVRVRLSEPQGGRDLVISTREPVTVGDLVRELAAAHDGPGDGLTTSGQPLAPGARWCDVAPVNGSIVTLGAREKDAPVAGSRFELAVVGGPMAGTRVPLARGTATVGRGSAASVRLSDPELSREHLRVVVDEDGVTVEDAGSTNRTLLDGEFLKGRQFVSDTAVIGMGRALVSLRGVPTVLRPGRRIPGTGQRVIQRPPRPAVVAPDRRVLVAPVLPTARQGFRFPWPALVVPLIASGVIVAITGRPLLLLMALFTPMMVLGNVWSESSARRREKTSRSKDYDIAREAHLDEVADALAAETASRRLADPDLALVHAAATAPTDLLWHRASGDADFLHVRLGTCSAPARSVDVRDDRAAGRPAPMVHDVPVLLDLRLAEVVGISGDQEVRDGLVRALLAQVATFHGPGDVGVTVLTSRGRAGEWDWVKWLPHAGGDAQGQRPEVSVAVDDAAHARAVHDALAQTARTTVVVVDAVPELEGSVAVAQLLLEAPSRAVVPVVLARHFHQLPRACRATVDLDGAAGSGGAVTTADGAVVAGPRWDQLHPVLADEIARGLAAWADPDTASTTPGQSSAQLPAEVGFLEALGRPDISPQAVVDRWHGPAGLTPTAVCGVGDNGRPVVVDLRSGHGGPNAFLAGTTGSGKSDFLRSFLTSLAVANPPDAIAMILIDFKEGSGLEVLHALPHVAGMITNEERSQLPRILTALAAEREVRQRRIKVAGYDSFDDYQAAGHAVNGQMPRLLVVVDEFAALRESVPEAMGRLVEIVRRGRSAGMHLLLGTQTVTSAVGQDIIDNTTLHVCLRVENDSESRSLVGVVDAARIATHERGRGFVFDGQSLRVFQSGWLGSRSLDPATEPAVLVSAFAVGDLAAEPEGAQSSELPTDLSRVLESLTAAAALAGVPRASAPWEPPLPPLVTLDELGAMVDADRNHSALALPLGLLDAPSRRTRLPWVVDFAQTGHLVVIGGSRSGRSTVLRTLACAASLRSDRVLIYVIEGAGRSLAGLSALPTVGAVVSADDTERLARLVRVLQAEVGARQALLHERGVGAAAELPDADEVAPPIFLLVDSFEALHDEGFDEDGAELIAAIRAFLREGPAVDVHVVLTTDPSKAQSRVVSSVGARLVLGLPQATQYVDAGVAREHVPVGDLPAGRGLLSTTGEEVQVGLLDHDPSGAAQGQAVERIARALHNDAPADGRSRAAARRVPLWAPAYRLGELDAAPTSGWDVVLGVGGDELLPVTVSLHRAGLGLLVAGARGAGRTEALRTIAAQLCDGTAGRPPVVVVNPRGGGRLAELSSLARPPEGLEGFDGVLALPDLLRRIQAPTVVVIDDGERLLEGAQSAALDEAVGLAADGGHVFVIASTSADLATASRQWIQRVKRGRNALFLRATSRIELQSLGFTVPRSPEPAPAAGRGVLFFDGVDSRVQVAVTT